MRLISAVIAMAIFTDTSLAIHVGDCIGPRQAFERFLNDYQRWELETLIERRFNGSNERQASPYKPRQNALLFASNFLRAT